MSSGNMNAGQGEGRKARRQQQTQERNEDGTNP